MYKTTRESSDCPCGGKVRAVPDLARRHEQTHKHRRWLFRNLCCEFLDITLPQDKKVEMLKEMKSLLIAV